MDANAIALLDIFEKKMRLEVPMFQRQYVWNEEHQWLPLWEDISRKFEEFIEGRTDAPIHFLGAMVLDQRQTQVGRVESQGLQKDRHAQRDGCVRASRVVPGSVRREHGFSSPACHVGRWGERAGDR